MVGEQELGPVDTSFHYQSRLQAKRVQHTLAATT